MASITQFAERVYETLHSFDGASALTTLIVLIPIQFILCELVWSPRYWKWVSVFIVYYLSFLVNFVFAMGLQIDLAIRFNESTTADSINDVDFQRALESMGFIMPLLVPATLAAIIYRWRRVPKNDSIAGANA